MLTIKIKFPASYFLLVRVVYYFIGHFHIPINRHLIKFQVLSVYSFMYSTRNLFKLTEQNSSVVKY